MAEYEIKCPLDDEKARSLKVWDQVYITGEVYTVRDMAYERILNAVHAGEELPFSLDGKAIWHCGPVTQQVGDKWKMISPGSTTSSRFTEPAAELVRDLGVKVIVGKGFMKENVASALKSKGAVYVVTTGGAAAYYASQVEEIEGVHWLDLGMPAAVWMLRVKRFGPLIVAMDSHGDSIFDGISSRVEGSVDRIMKDLEIDPKRKYTWWP